MSSNELPCLLNNAEKIYKGINSTSRITGRPRHNKSNTLIFPLTNLNNFSVNGRRMVSVESKTTIRESFKWNSGGTLDYPFPRIDKTNFNSIHNNNNNNNDNNLSKKYNTNFNSIHNNNNNNKYNNDNNNKYNNNDNNKEHILRLRRFSPQHYLDVHRLKNRLGMLKMSRCCKRTHNKVGFALNLKSSYNKDKSSELLDNSHDGHGSYTLLSLTEVFPFSENLSKSDESSSLPMITPMDKARITSKAIRDQLEDVLDSHWNTLQHRNHNYKHQLTRLQERMLCQPPPSRISPSQLGDDGSDADGVGKSERATPEEILLVLKHFLSMGTRKSALKHVCRLISDNMIAFGSYHHKCFIPSKINTTVLPQSLSPPLKDTFRYILIDLVNSVNKKQHSNTKTMKIFMARLLLKLRAKCEQLDDVFTSVLNGDGDVNNNTGFELLYRLSYTRTDVERLLTILHVPISDDDDGGDNMKVFNEEESLSVSSDYFKATSQGKDNFLGKDSILDY